MREKLWLDDLKVGDKVAQYSGYSRDDLRCGRVERLTATQVITDSGRYRRADGRSVGNSTGYYRSGIVEMTAEIALKIRRREMLSRLQGLSWSNAPNQVLVDVLAVYDAALKAKAESKADPSSTGGAV